MKKFVSIRRKLISKVMVIISLIFISILAAVLVKDVRSLNRNLKKSQETIEAELIAKGTTLTRNNATALTRMVEDNSFGDIRRLVSETVKNDRDIAYGIFMGPDRRPWAFADKSDTDGTPISLEPLDDALSNWAASVQSVDNSRLSKTSSLSNVPAADTATKNIIEFAAPVFIEGEIAGTIRYAFSTESMKARIDEVKSDAADNRNLTLFIISLLGILSLVGSYISIRVIAVHIVRPIGKLVDSTKIIAQGNYRESVEAETNDEIGSLANDVDVMRQSIRELTENLEQKVQDRTAALSKANEEIEKLNKKLSEENLRLGAELDVARQIQEMVLPSIEEQRAVKGLDIAGVMRPADEVGGDYYDVLSNGAGVKIGIGDVTGHGLESGVMMLMAQTAIRTLQEAGEADPARLLDIVNRTLYQNIKRMHADKNMTLSIVDYKDGNAVLSGQHEELLLIRNDGQGTFIETINLGFPIGLEGEIGDLLHSTSFHLNKGDGFVLFTDGITEAENMNGEYYGPERLKNAVCANWDKTAQEIEKAVLRDIETHIGNQTVYDDITLVVVKQL
ncbi:MAG: SpoIIE family protein phosphatase [Deltaproteobacteria bacterium]|nr:SpoIIE family protein phosphatase [Deltaproteobacteria bacterium]